MGGIKDNEGISSTFNLKIVQTVQACEIKK